MLTIEIRVNGSIAVAMSAVNRGTPVGSQPGVAEYEYQAVTFPIDSQGPCETRHGKVRHLRGDGIKRLAEKLFIAASSPGSAAGGPSG